MSAKQLVDTIINAAGRKRLAQVYSHPFKYDQRGQCIVDTQERVVLDIRGWSWLQKWEDGAKIQDAMGYLIVELLNTEFGKIRDWRQP